MTAPVAHGIAAALPFLVLAIIVVFVAWRRSCERRRSMEAQHRVRGNALAAREAMYARDRAGMGVWHPETPGPASDAEARLLADLLDGIDIPNFGGSA